MKILFDQNIPRLLRRSLSGYEVKTAFEMRWDQLDNGDLLEVAEAAQFDLLVTADRRLRYQQNLLKRRIAIIELTTNHWPSIKLRLAEFVNAVLAVPPRSYLIVECPKHRRKINEDPRE